MTPQLMAWKTQPAQQWYGAGEIQQAQSPPAQQADLDLIVDRRAVVHHEKKQATPLEHSMYLHQRPFRVWDVMQHTEGVDGIKRPVGELHGSGVHLLHAA